MCDDVSASPLQKRLSSDAILRFSTYPLAEYSRSSSPDSLFGEDSADEYDTELQDSLATWSFSEAIRPGKSKLATVFHLPSYSDVVYFGCTSTTRGLPAIDGGACMYESAKRLEAISRHGTISQRQKRVVTRIQSVTPYQRGAHEIIFEPAEPCPKSWGVALIDILDQSTVCIRDPTAPVIDHLESSPIVSINVLIILQFPDKRGHLITYPIIKYPIVTACDCGPITRAKLAWDIARIMYEYGRAVLPQVQPLQVPTKKKNRSPQSATLPFPVPLDDMQLIALTADEYSRDWTAHFAWVEWS